MKFVGARLRQARVARGLTGTALAGVANISPSIISGYEKGAKSPSPDTIERLARVLDVPARIFFKKMPESDSREVFYRSVSSATKGLRETLNERAAWVCEIFDFLENHFYLSDVNLPQLDLPTDSSRISKAMVDEAARATREAWGLGDDGIPTLAGMMEDNGVTISKFQFDSEKMDGFSFWHRTKFPIVVIAGDKNSRSRTRFDLAHELGHLVLGHRRGEICDPAEVKRQEDQAHRFASALLLPREAIAADLDEVLCDPFRRSILNSLGPLKIKWGASFAAILYAARDLEKISDQQFQSAYVMLSQRGWRKTEPLEEELPEEKPCLLRSCIEALVEGGDLTPRKVLEMLALPAKDTAEICGLPETYFEEMEEERKPLIFKRRD